MRMSEILCESVPDHLLRRYLRGRCFAFAVALHRRLKLPFWGLFDAEGDLHHVFVADVSKQIGYDIRGGLPLADIGKGSLAEEDAIPPRAITRAEAEAVYGRAGRAEVREAERVIDSGVWKP
jgi:hypothetical protein